MIARELIFAGNRAFRQKYHKASLGEPLAPTKPGKAGCDKRE